MSPNPAHNLESPNDRLRALTRQRTNRDDNAPFTGRNRQRPARARGPGLSISGDGPNEIAAAGGTTVAIAIARDPSRGTCWERRWARRPSPHAGSRASSCSLPFDTPPTKSALRSEARVFDQTQARRQKRGRETTSPRVVVLTLRREARSPALGSSPRRRGAVE